VEAVEGMRSSKERLVKDVEGAEKEYLVRKCARANLDGSIVRELAGMKNMPLEELKRIAPEYQWEQRAAKGKGYGNQADRQAVRESSKADVPNCPKCGGPMWDNREKKTNPKAPDFTCKQTNGPCGEQKGNYFNKTGIWLDKDKDKGSAGNGGVETQNGGTDERAPNSGAPSADEIAEEKKRRIRSIKAQFKGRQLDAAKQVEFLEEYFDSAGLEGDDRTIENLGLDMLIEINEDLKKPAK
jgi:hypothetical protein